MSSPIPITLSELWEWLSRIPSHNSLWGRTPLESQQDANAVTRHKTHNPVNRLLYIHYLLMFAQSQIPIRGFQHVLRHNQCVFRRVPTCRLTSPPKSGCWYLLLNLAPWLSFILVVHAIRSNMYSLHARKCVCQSHAIFSCEGAYSISTPLRTDTFRTICLYHQRKIFSMGVYGVLYGDARDPTANLGVHATCCGCGSVDAGMCVTCMHVFIYVQRWPSPWHFSLLFVFFHFFCIVTQKKRL